MGHTEDGRLVRNGSVLFAAVGDDLVMLDVEANRYYSLNGSGRQIWELLERPRSLAEIGAELQRIHAVDAASFDDELSGFARTLLDAGLIASHPTGEVVPDTDGPALSAAGVARPWMRPELLQEARIRSAAAKTAPFTHEFHGTPNNPIIPSVNVSS
jgi:hypothetical protein